VTTLFAGAPTKLPMMDLSAIIDPDKDIESRLKRKLLLTFVCHCRRPRASADELNRTHALCEDSADVEQCLDYISRMGPEFSEAYDGVDLECVMDIIGRTPEWLRYGSAIEMWTDLKQL
jgi:hypothetical protein